MSCFKSRPFDVKTICCCVNSPNFSINNKRQLPNGPGSSRAPGIRQLGYYTVIIKKLQCKIIDVTCCVKPLLKMTV